MRYTIISYGCQMNEYDSGRLAAMLELCGATPEENPADSDVILVNTCSVREKAEENAIARIGGLKRFKVENECLKIGVLGCMAKNRGDSLFKDLPFIDFVLAPDCYNRLPEILFGENTLNDAEVFAKFSGRASAFVAIQQGCNMRCSYCIVPFVRGREQYRDCGLILQEVEANVRNNVSEITLLGQTVNGWRHGGLSFADLLSRVAGVKGVERIRFMSPHPKHYTGELMDVLLSEPKIAPHVHLPAQSGSDGVLKNMRRQYSRKEYLSVVEVLRSFNPLYGITTDIICGYPGETKEDFEQTLSLLQEVQFDGAFMFAYSPRKGTPSFSEREVIGEEEKLARLQRTIDLQNSITLERTKLMLGRRERVLIEKRSRKNRDEWVGRTGNFKKVILPSSPLIKEGAYMDCKIESIKGHTLIGSVDE